MRREAIGSLSRLTLLHLVANALLLGFGYYWLGIRESQTSTLLGSALLGLILLGLVCWTYGTPFAYFQTEQQRAAIASWRATLSRLVPLAVAACAIAAIYWLIERWAEYSGSSTIFAPLPVCT